MCNPCVNDFMLGMIRLRSLWCYQCSQLSKQDCIPPWLAQAAGLTHRSSSREGVGGAQDEGADDAAVQDADHDGGGSR